MNTPGIIHWIFGVVMLVGAVLAVWEMYRDSWRTDWEWLATELLSQRSNFEEKIYKYDSEVNLERISDEYVQQLIKSIGNKRHDKTKTASVALTDYLLRRGATGE